MYGGNHFPPGFVNLICKPPFAKASIVTTDDGEEPTSGLSYGKETIHIDVHSTSIDGLSFSVVSGHDIVAVGAVGKRLSAAFVYMNRVRSRCVDGW